MRMKRSQKDLKAQQLRHLQNRIVFFWNEAVLKVWILVAGYPVKTQDGMIALVRIDQEPGLKSGFKTASLFFRRK